MNEISQPQYEALKKMAGQWDLQDVAKSQERREKEEAAEKEVEEELRDLLDELFDFVRNNEWGSLSEEQKKSLEVLLAQVGANLDRMRDFDRALMAQLQELITQIPEISEGPQVD